MIKVIGFDQHFDSLDAFAMDARGLIRHLDRASFPGHLVCDRGPAAVGPVRL